MTSLSGYDFKSCSDHSFTKFGTTIPHSAAEQLVVNSTWAGMADCNLAAQAPHESDVCVQSATQSHMQWMHGVINTLTA